MAKSTNYSIIFNDSTKILKYVEKKRFSKKEYTEVECKYNNVFLLFSIDSITESITSPQVISTKQFIDIMWHKLENSYQFNTDLINKLYVNSLSFVQYNWYQKKYLIYHVRELRAKIEDENDLVRIRLGDYLTFYCNKHKIILENTNKRVNDQSIKSRLVSVDDLKCKKKYTWIWNGLPSAPSKFIMTYTANVGITKMNDEKSQNGAFTIELASINDIPLDKYLEQICFEIIKTKSKNTFFLYKIKKKDTLYSISKEFHTTIEAIKVDNGLTDNKINIGQVLKIQNYEQ